MKSITTHYLLDKIFRILFHEDSPIHIKTLLSLADNSLSEDYETVLDALTKDNRFQSHDLINWTLNPGIFTDILQQPIGDMEFVVTDIEATGPEFHKERIIEIGAVKIKNGKKIDQFHSFVNPQKKVPGSIFRLTGIKQSRLDASPDIVAVLREFSLFWGHGIFCAHNSDFDLPFINSELHRIGIDAFRSIPEICTLRLARKLVPEIKKHGIVSLSDYFNYSLNKQHSAIEDAAAAGFCLNRLIDRFDPERERSGMALIDVQRKRKGKHRLNKNAYKQKLKNPHRRHA